MAFAIQSCAANGIGNAIDFMPKLSQPPEPLATMSTRLEAIDGMPPLVGCVCENEECRAAHIDGFPGYAVTECGRVFSCRAKGGWGRSYRDEWKLLKPHSNHNALQQVGLRRLGKQHWLLVSHLVLSHFDRPGKPNECALHLDDDKANCSLENLEWTTRSECCHARMQIAERDQPAPADQDQLAPVDAIELHAKSMGLTAPLYCEFLNDLAIRATSDAQALIPSRPVRVVPDYETGALKPVRLWP